MPTDEPSRRHRNDDQIASLDDEIFIYDSRYVVKRKCGAANLRLECAKRCTGQPAGAFAVTRCAFLDDALLLYDSRNVVNIVSGDACRKMNASVEIFCENNAAAAGTWRPPPREAKRRAFMPHHVASIRSDDENGSAGPCDRGSSRGNGTRRRHARTNRAPGAVSRPAACRHTRTGRA